jgi:hypothetical protein
VPALITQLRRCGMSEDELTRVFRTFNAAAPEFNREVTIDVAPT